MVCAEILQCSIHIAQAHGVQVIHPSVSIREPIWLAYDGSMHYDSVFSSNAVFGATPDDFGESPEAPSNPLPEQPAPLGSPLPDQVPPVDVSSDGCNVWTFLSANVTSFSAQQASLMELAFDVVAVQETRHTVKSQNGFTLFLKNAGYQAVWGKPQPFRAAKSTMHTTTGLNGRPGGVAIFAKAEIPLQFVPPGECAIRKRLFHSCRWVHAVAAFGNCKQVIHIFSVYGFTGGYSHQHTADLNEALLKDVLDVTQSLGSDAPVLIMGDLNVEAGDSPVLSEALSKGFVFDLCFRSGPTFFPTHGKARRLDVCLATRSAASTLLAARTIETSGLPGHLPLHVELNLPCLNERVTRLRKPAAFPTTFL